MSDDGFGGRELSLDDPLGEGDEGWDSLELDTSSGAQSSTKDPQDLLFGEAGGRVLGDAFDGLGGSADAELELDMDALRGPANAAPTDLPAPPTDLPAPPAAGTASVARSLPPIRSSSPAGRMSSGPPRRTSGAPGRRSSLAPQDEAPIPPRAITLADFGDPPTGILGVVPYAVHAVLRQRALKTDLARLTRLRDAAQKDRDDALIDLGRALHANRDHSALEGLAVQMKKANLAGDVTGQHTAEWQRMREAADTQKESIGAKIAEVEERAAPTRAREGELATQLGGHETTLKRAEAKLSRIKIELRNLAKAPEPDPSRQRSLEAEREARAAEVARARDEVDALRPGIDAVRRELATFTREIAALEKQVREVDKSRGRSEKVLSSSAKAAEGDYHTAVTEMAEHAMARGIAAAVAPQLEKLARNRAQALTTREEEIELHEVALTLSDKKSVQKGLAIIGVVALISVATLVFAIVR